MVQFLPWDKYTKDKKKVYILENYLYLYNANGDDLINVRGIFEDPEKLTLYKSCEGEVCYDSNSEYPLPMDMLQMLTTGILNGEMKLLAVTTSDTTNDAAQESPGQIPPASQSQAKQ